MKIGRFGLLLLGVAFSACSTSAFVDQVVIDNPTAYRASVAVAGEDGTGWTLLATVDPRSEAEVEEVYEQGSKWIFRFSYSGHSEQLEIPRSQLARGGWSVTVPESFEAELKRQGVTPPP